jgi:hypothetical protein
MTNKADSVIEFQAQVWSIKTLVDGGMNVTLSLSDKDIKQISQLLECKKRGALLEVAAVPIEMRVVNAKETKVDKGPSSRRKRRHPYRD